MNSSQKKAAIRAGNGPELMGGVFLFAALFLLAVALLSLAVCLPVSKSMSGEASGSQNNSYEPSNGQSENLQPAQRIDGDVSSQAASQTESQKSDETESDNLGQDLIVRFIDVGQGDCALISCGDAHMLIDGGLPDASSKVYTILKNLGIDHLDCIIASHPDADHIGGISGALNFATCDVCYCSTTENDTATFDSMKRYLARQGKAITVPNLGDSFSLNGATITFIGPVTALEETNNNSLVCRIDYGETSFLFTGDAELEEELSLVNAQADLSADVLKVGHHGSASSSSSSFLQRVNPSYAVISVGADNTYGHPTDVVLQRLANNQVNVMRTDEMGNIIIRSDGSNLICKTTQGAINE